MSPILSKILEHTLRSLFSEFLTTSKFQFGFKKNSSTNHAVFCFKETINYYCERGSNVFCSFLDASKAFDRLVHAGLYIKLMSRNTPLLFLDIIISWYGELYCHVRWDDAYSKWFCIAAGVRQGGILSPDYYSLYVDDLVLLLMKLNVGCYIRNVFVLALLYADDMALLSPSLRGLQQLLSACEQFCKNWDICLNKKKVTEHVLQKAPKQSLQTDSEWAGSRMGWEMAISGHHLTNRPDFQLLHNWKNQKILSRL